MTKASRRFSLKPFYAIHKSISCLSGTHVNFQIMNRYSYSIEERIQSKSQSVQKKGAINGKNCKNYVDYFDTYPKTIQAVVFSQIHIRYKYRLRKDMNTDEFTI